MSAGIAAKAVVPASAGMPAKAAIPAQAGTHLDLAPPAAMDSRLRGNDAACGGAAAAGAWR
jgi:hypothetical protein